MVKKKILAVARCWLYVSLLGCYIFQVRVSFLNTTVIFYKIEASNNEHSLNRFFVAIWNLTNWPLIGQETQTEQKEPVRT